MKNELTRQVWLETMSRIRVWEPIAYGNYKPNNKIIRPRTENSIHSDVSLRWGFEQL